MVVGVTQYYPEIWDPKDGELTAERLLTDQAIYAKFADACCEKFPEAHRGVIADEFALLNDPPRMQALIVEHLRWMWDHLLAEEWQRVQPMLYESVAAFETMDFSNMTAYEAIRAVTTRDMRGRFDEKLEDADTIVFIPSAHIGPYVVTTKIGTTIYMVFGARLPRGWQTPSSALSRSELLIRLNALADDTRLRILELLTKNEELCAQDIIEQLNLSQSSISRHLSQLSANGFITERRREVAKCYSLNTDRVVDTLRTLTNYLSRP
jgi:DNA-binding transcriptional ArsR family regulator